MDYITSQLKDSPNTTKGKYYGLNRRDSKESLDSMKDSALSSNDDVSSPLGFSPLPARTFANLALKTLARALNVNHSRQRIANNFACCSKAIALICLRKRSLCAVLIQMPKTKITPPIKPASSSKPHHRHPQSQLTGAPEQSSTQIGGLRTKLFSALGFHSPSPNPPSS